MSSQLRPFGMVLPLVLGAGLVAQIVGVDMAPRAIENRVPAPRPTVSANPDSLRRLLPEFDQWFSDHFALRNTLIYANSLWRNLALHTPSSPKVMFGQDGWLYYTGDSTVDFARHDNLFTSTEVQQVADKLELRTRLLAARGIVYVVMIAPNPSSIYPEHQPAWLRRQLSPIGRVDQLVAEAARRGTFTVVDPRGALLKAKSQSAELLYMPTDTHWNGLGAWIGYAALMEGIDSASRRVPGAPAVPAPLPLSSFEQRRAWGPGGDLAGMLGLAQRTREQRIELVPRASKMIAPVVGQPVDTTTRWTNPSPDTHVLVFRDSYFVAMFPMFSESFSRVRYVWRTYDSVTVNQERPQIVVEEMAERFLTAARFATP